MIVIFSTEIKLLLRRSQQWLYPFSFFLIVISLFPLALSPDPVFLRTYIPGCIWIAALLANFLAIENFFTSDLEDGHLEQLILSDVPLWIIVLTKIVAQWLVTQAPLFLLTPLLGVLFGLSFATTSVLTLSLVLGTPLLTLLGALIVALTLGLKQQGMMIGLLLFPLCVPILIFGVSMVQSAQMGFAISGPIAMMSGLLLLAMVLLPMLIATTLSVTSDN